RQSVSPWSESACADARRLWCGRETRVTRGEGRLYAESVISRDASKMSTFAAEKPVLVVGAGPGGLCAAAALHRRGIPVHVLEQADELRTAGAGLTIQINAMRMLESLGLDRAVARAGATLETAKVCRADG